jgi:bla regulator protein BlaR1
MAAALWQASLAGAIAVAVVWLVCRLVPALPASARTILWWCAAAKFLIALAAVSPIEVPILPAAFANAGTEVPAYVRPENVGPNFSSGANAGTKVPAYVPSDSSSAGLKPRGYDRAEANAPSFITPLVALWSLGLLAAATFAVARWRRTARFVRESDSADASTQEMTSQLAAAMGVTSVPVVRVSREIETPLVAGVRRPVVLIPFASFSSLSERQQQMAICHELAHIKRADLRLGCVPAMAEALFFFHPLAHVAAREYALWREAACDAAVLDALDAEPREYGRLLLDLGVARPRAGLAAAGASWSLSNLKRRLVMLNHSSSSTPSWKSRALTIGALGVAVLALVPLTLVARPAAPTTPPAQVQTIVTEESEQARPQTEAERARIISEIQRLQRQLEGLESKELGQLAELNKALKGWNESRQLDDLKKALDKGWKESAQLEELRKVLDKGWSERAIAEEWQAKERDLNYVLFYDDNNTTMSGSMRDIERARQFKQGNEKLLWFRKDGREWIVRDPMLLRQVEAIWIPVNEIGAKQGEIGAQQGRIGALQGEIGAKQGMIGAQQGLIGAKQGELGSREGRLSMRESRRELSETERQQISEERRILRAQQRELDAEMEKLNVKMREFEKPMNELNREIEKFNAPMEKLSQDMERESRKAESEMRKLLEGAISSGKAQAVR